jgi:hypothetical protein
MTDQSSDDVGIDSQGHIIKGKTHVCNPFCMGIFHSGIMYVREPLNLETAEEICQMGGLILLEVRDAPEAPHTDPVYHRSWPYRYLMTWIEESDWPRAYSAKLR